MLWAMVSRTPGPAGSKAPVAGPKAPVASCDGGDVPGSAAPIRQFGQSPRGASAGSVAPQSGHVRSGFMAKSSPVSPTGRTGGETTAPGVLDSIAASIGPVPRVLLRDTAPGEEPGPIVRPPSGGDDDRSIRYRIDGEIARGGMGAILKGRDPDLGRDVALKVLREDHRDDADMIRRFVEEAQIGGQLQHPGDRKSVV